MTSNNEGRSRSPVKKTTKKAKTSSATATSKVSTINKVTEALRSCEDKNGMSLLALKKYMAVYYPETESLQGFNHRLKKAILKGLESGAFIRPAKSRECTGASGRFKLAKAKPVTKKRSRSASPAAVKPRKQTRSFSSSPAKKSKIGEKTKPQKVVKPKPRSKSPATGKAKLSAKAATDKKTAVKKSPRVSKKSAPVAKKTKSPKTAPKSPVAKATKKTGAKKLKA